MYYYTLIVNKIPVGVLGASGYVGRELCALIQAHPGLSLAFATANEQRGSTTRIGGRDITYLATEDARLSDAQLVFSALPHGASRQWVSAAREEGARVIDLSNDLRPGNGCEGVAYGLTELNRAVVANATGAPKLLPSLEKRICATPVASSVAESDNVTAA